MRSIKDLPATVAAFAREVIRRPHWWAEAWAAIGAIGIGLLNMASTTGGIDLNPRYSMLAEIMPSWAWTLAALSIGVAQLIALARVSPLGRTLAGFAGAVLWGGFTWGLALKDPGSTTISVVPFACLLGINTVAMLRALRRLP